MRTDTAKSLLERQDRKVNGPKGFKMTSCVVGDRRAWLSYWRRATEYAPGFNFKVTYHYPEA